MQGFVWGPQESHHKMVYVIQEAIACIRVNAYLECIRIKAALHWLIIMSCCLIFALRGAIAITGRHQAAPEARLVLAMPVDDSLFTGLILQI